ncbi:flagellar biosynthesis protein FlhB [Natroniella sulfidigena]|uniref:flagellar biosynthesis protein FlhB n=1 Tax=Natroniella sulfidigena TaxID=723921 RepID=UPI00200A2642|nr:flagellar biosynthesis protein FlhB [Natroniella sulfidigena]MCK8816514.1 flagellar biosynthesis protein FlhB [Natroniella sulfidigena]
MPEEEKTEDPTPKRRQQAREEGQVASSKELNSAFTLLFSFIILYFLMRYLIDQIIEFTYKSFAIYLTMEMTANNFYNLLLEIGFLGLRLIAPILFIVTAVGVAITYLQIGFLFTPKTLIPKISKLNPIEGAKQLLSKRTFVELIKSLLKVGIIAYISYLTIRGVLDQYVLLTTVGLNHALELIGDTAFSLAMRVSGFMIIIGIIDLIYQKWEHEQQLKMTKQEVKEERKQMEGSPEVKSKRKQKQQEMAMSRMMQDVPEADVVITNPTHIAVAVKFDLETMEVPVLIAKGQGEIAQKIKEVAIENEIEIVEEKPLARALYKLVEIGEEIPYELYQAVAEILAYVYQMDEERRS